MTLGTWWLYVVTVFVVSATPGPNMLHVMGRSVALGFRRSVWAMAGCMSAVLLALTASVLGLATFLAAFPRLFDLLRYVGVAYLLWLGIKSWRADAGPADPTGEDRAAAGFDARATYRTALFTGLSNPKLIVFAGALFPQFIDPHAAREPQLAVLLGTFVVIEGGWYIAYALGGRRLARHLARPGRQRLFNRLTGGLFVAFGVGMLAARA